MSEDERLHNTERAARTSLPPVRSYELPGGPYASGLAPISVAKLAEVERGGERDFAR